ncbi:unnamed protein product [Adineta steineri]|uniref:Uncharacterized protein n=1 Tax=Adineta steineri TaxID=433720 RepID=A0A815LW00_9BILA|nr:unnamed protein product [Adineta steineri]
MNSQQLLYYQTPLSALLLIPFIFYMENFPVYKTYEEQQIAVVASGIVGFVEKKYPVETCVNMIKKYLELYHLGSLYRSKPNHLQSANDILEQLNCSIKQ